MSTFEEDLQRANVGRPVREHVQALVTRTSALEEQVRIMAKILGKLVSLHPEANETVAYETTITHEVVPTQSISQDEFYASREAKMAKEELERIREVQRAEREAEDKYLQRRRNFPLDPPSSAEPDDDFLW